MPIAGRALALVSVAVLFLSAPSPALVQPGAPGARSLDSCLSGDARSDNEAWTTRSWSLLNAGNFRGAVDNVLACLARWSNAAAQSQAEMDDKHLACPPVGAVDGSKQSEINANGLLNDVATNYFILGSAYEKLGDRQAAQSAYRTCARLRCARTWDPRNYYWAPAAACTAKLPSAS